MMTSPNTIGYREYGIVGKAITVITFIASASFVLFMIVLVNL